MHARRIPAVVAALSLLCAGAVVAAPTPVEVASGIPHEALFAVDFDGATGYAVGAGGEILASTDGGATWTREETPTRLSMLGVSVRGDRAIAVGQMGAVLVRGGDGRWTEVQSGTEERLFGVDVNGDGVALAVGAFGALLRSTDGGRTWASSAPAWPGTFKDTAGRLGDFFEPSMYAVQLADDGRAWVVGELGLALRSEDGGVSWTVGHAGESSVDGVDPTLFGLDMRADGVGFAVGQEGYILKTTDDGASWTAIERPTHANLLDVSATGDGTVLATGMRDMLLSTDHGNNWERVRGADIATGWYSGVAHAQDRNAPLAVGNAARILRVEM
ncbi:WD40/YVTN/BNR-like repeat-containing protein [Sinimarinibacterium flocculans]|uniref:WD40/YVTN/BNR-like repeat-containing protein n=1 Tax=Sinimarinibacterium flocculans TaxID=985250 RepID=UPI0024904FB1|nr:YCF48-related protein [Sinimarinibacterium flocculans]